MELASQPIAGTYLARKEVGQVVNEHWNIQLNVQKVTETPEGDAVKRFAEGKAPIRKDTLQVAEIKVQAETEAEAYAKVRRLLDASQSPNSYGVGRDPQGFPAGMLSQPPEGTSYRPIRDNPQA